MWTQNLRGQAGPISRDENSAADLARIFVPIREAKIDLRSISSGPPVDSEWLRLLEMTLLLGGARWPLNGTTNKLHVSF